MGAAAPLGSVHSQADGERESVKVELRRRPVDSGKRRPIYPFDDGEPVVGIEERPAVRRMAGGSRCR